VKKAFFAIVENPLHSFVPVSPSPRSTDFWSSQRLLDHGDLRCRM
jgi:hypothetical protein